MIAIFLTVVLTENYVLCQFLGICPFLGVSKKLNTAVGMSLAVIFVMALATAATYPINKYLLVKNDLEYLQTIVFILVIAALVQFVEIILKKFIYYSFACFRSKGHMLVEDMIYIIDAQISSYSTHFCVTGCFIYGFT